MRQCTVVDRAAQDAVDETTVASELQILTHQFLADDQIPNKLSERIREQQR
jgi:hypothetical protein